MQNRLRCRHRDLFPRWMWRANRELRWLVLLALAGLVYRIWSDVLAMLCTVQADL